MALFSGKIKCKICGGNFKSKRERKVRKYVCSRYDNYGARICERHILSEEELIFVIERHFNQKLQPEEIKNKIKTIEVYSDNVVIKYIDNTTSEFNDKQIRF